MPRRWETNQAVPGILHVLHTYFYQFSFYSFRNLSHRLEQLHVLGRDLIQSSTQAPRYLSATVYNIFRGMAKQFERHPMGSLSHIHIVHKENIHIFGATLSDIMSNNLLASSTTWLLRPPTRSPWTDYICRNNSWASLS